VSDNFQWALEQQNEALLAEVETWKKRAEFCRTSADAMESRATTAEREAEEARDQARIATRERDAAREAADDWKTCASQEQALKEQAENDRDAAVETARKAHADWESTVARAEMEQARADRLESELDAMEKQCGEWQLTANEFDQARLKAEADCAALVSEVVRASAELRHAYRRKDDWNLVARAIEILERAPNPGGGHHAGPALLDRLLAAEAVVEALREEMHDQDEPTKVSSKTYEAFAAYDAVVKP
jgi:chromosome segregation ATPase